MLIVNCRYLWMLFFRWWNSCCSEGQRRRCCGLRLHQRQPFKCETNLIWLLINHIRFLTNLIRFLIILIQFLINLMLFLINLILFLINLIRFRKILIRFRFCLYRCRLLSLSHRRRLWGAARASAPNNWEMPMYLSLFNTFSPQYFGLPTQYFWQVYASALCPINITWSRNSDHCMSVVRGNCGW